MVYYDVYCTNCETVQATSKNMLGSESKQEMGAALSDLIDKSKAGELCCYNGTCMMDEDYVVRKAEETVKFTRLDDADVDIR